MAKYSVTICWDDDHEEFDGTSIILKSTITIAPIHTKQFASLFSDVVREKISDSISELCSRYILNIDSSK